MKHNICHTTIKHTRNLAIASRLHSDKQKSIFRSSSPQKHHFGTRSDEDHVTCLGPMWSNGHSLFGHICRLPENTLASQALQPSIEAHTGTPPAADWKRRPGRPRRNWLQQVEEDIDLSVGAARIAGQDRSMWRTLRPSAGQAQQ